MFDPPAELYPVAEPPVTLPTNLSMRISAMMGEVLKQHPESAPYFADQISAMTGYPMSVAALYACTAPSKPEHDIGVSRVVAFAKASGATWIIAEMARECGLTVLEGREALFAQLGAARQQSGLFDQKKREADQHARRIEEMLRSDPVQPRQPYRKRS